MLQLLDLLLQVRDCRVLRRHDLLGTRRVRLELHSTFAQLLGFRNRLLNRRLVCQRRLQLPVGRFARSFLRAQLRCRLGQLEALGGQLLLHVADLGLGLPGDL